MAERSATAFAAQILDPGDSGDQAVLDRLRDDPGVQFLDRRAEQLASLRALRPAPDQRVLAEPGRWAYYPWRRTVVAVLGPRGFRARLLYTSPSPRDRQKHRMPSSA